MSALATHLLDTLAGASTLFLLAVGLSLIFGVSRIVNFAHGSMYMLGLYLGCSLTRWFGAEPLGFWGAVLLSALTVAALGALIEVLLLRRLYRAPELFQLLATFALVLMLRDAALWLWGPEDILGPKAPGLRGAVAWTGRAFPAYDLLLIAVGPLVLLALWMLLHRTRAGMLIRAATQDREMAGALGVNQSLLFTGVFALGSGLAALGGALQMPREPASLALDLGAIGDAFVVVVVGGMGSVGGAYLAALLIALVKTTCYALGSIPVFGTDFAVSRLTLAVEFMVMAVVLVRRPWGLLGRPQAEARAPVVGEPPPGPMQPVLARLALVMFAVLALLPLTADALPYASVLMIDILIAVLFAASLHFIMGPAGMHSFGHAAYFGLGTYAAALLFKQAQLPMELALLTAPLVALTGALLFGWFVVRLSGVYLAMLTLAFAQIVWSVVFQWDGFTGGSNGLIGIWPSDRLSAPGAYYWLCLLVVGASLHLLRRMQSAPFGLTIRASRDAPQRAEATGIHVARVRWLAFACAGLFCGMAGALFAFAKGSISPETISVARSVDGLVMVLLGGLQAPAGPVVGAAVFSWLQDTMMRTTDYWRALLGLVILVLVLVFPQGIAGTVAALTRLWRAREVA